MTRARTVKKCGTSSVSRGGICRVTERNCLTAVKHIDPKPPALESPLIISLFRMETDPVYSIKRDYIALLCDVAPVLYQCDLAFRNCQYATTDMINRHHSNIQPLWGTPAEIELLMKPNARVRQAFSVVLPKLEDLFSEACKPSHDLPEIAAVRCGLCWLLQRLAHLWSELQDCEEEFEHQVTPNEAYLIKREGES